MAFVYYVVPAVIVLALLRRYRIYKWGCCKNKVTLNGKVVLVTGANSGIGFEAAQELVRRGAKVILACRDTEKANDAINKIQSNLGMAGLMVPMQLDLASIKSIESFVNELNKSEKKIDILVNNAGVAYPGKVRKTTEDGFEMHFGVNHLGHFLLTKLLLPHLQRAAPSRIIIVSSTLHQSGNIYLDDLNMENMEGKTNGYNNSKLANAYFCRALAERVKPDKINVYSVCPGWVYTALFRNYSVRWYHYILVAPIAFWFMRSAKQGVQTVIYCATEPSLDDESGHFYRDCKRYKSKVKFDPDVSRKLWEASDRMIEEKRRKLH